MVKDNKHRTNLGSGAICIVVDKIQKLRLKQGDGLITIDEMGYVILSKIEFLINPNLDDNVFMHQLPAKVTKVLELNKLK